MVNGKSSEMENPKLKSKVLIAMGNYFLDDRVVG